MAFKEDNESSLGQASEMTGKTFKSVEVDKGYRGRKSVCGIEVVIPGKISKKLSYYQQRKKRKRNARRAAIEPVIGHLKSDSRMTRCFLKGALARPRRGRLEPQKVDQRASLGLRFMASQSLQLARTLPSIRNGLISDSRMTLFQGRLGRIVLCILAFCCFVGCSDFGRQKQIDMKRAAGVRNFLTSLMVLTLPSGDLWRQVYRDELHLTDEMVSSGFNSIESAESAILGPFPQSTTFECVRLWLDPVYSEGGVLVVPEFWIVIRESDAVIFEGPTLGLRKMNLEEFREYLNAIYIRLEDAEQKSKMEAQIGFISDD